LHLSRLDVGEDGEPVGGRSPVRDHGISSVSSRTARGHVKTLAGGAFRPSCRAPRGAGRLPPARRSAHLAASAAGPSRRGLAMTPSMWADEAQRVLFTYAVPIGGKIVGAIALWVVGRVVISGVQRVVERGLEHRKLDTTLSRYVRSMIG